MPAQQFQGISNEAYSNWGWRYPQMYQPQQQNQMQTTQDWFSANPSMTVSRQGGVGYPSTLPMDPNTMNQFLLPALLQQFQSQLQTTGKAEGAKVGMDYAEKIGLTQPAEPSASMDYRTKQSLSDALRSVQAQTARSGMSLSSVRDQANESVMQQAFETMTRNAQDEEQKRKSLLAQLLAQFAR